MTVTIKEIFRLYDLSPKKRTLVKVGLGLSFLPGLICISYNLLTNIEGPNPFFIVLIFIFGIPTMLIGLVTYLLSDNILKRKLAFSTLTILFQVALLPILWGINDIKIKLFLYYNQTELEYIATNLLDKKWTWEQAKTYKENLSINVTLSGHIEEDETVLFTISSFIDNAHGVAYSRTGNEAYRKIYGHIAKWEKIKNNWYAWATN